MKTHKNLSIIFAVIMLFSLVLVGGAAAKTADKVDICHSKGNSSFVLINVSSDAYPTHLLHGDNAPGEAVPGQPGMVFAADCSVFSVTQKELAQTLTILPFDAAGKPADKVDVCHRRLNGTFILINISGNAYPAHLAHGDAAPGEAVPGQPGKRFAADCSVFLLPQKELVETLTVLPFGAFVVSQPLQCGQAYEIKASGTFTYDSALDWADAEFYITSGVIVKGDTEGSVPYLFDLCINGYSTNTDWGDYQSTHVYTKPWVGTGTPLNFSIYDSAYGDNTGSLTVEIWIINW